MRINNTLACNISLQLIIYSVSFYIKLKNISLTLALIVIVNCFLHAQDVSYRSLTTKDGLPSNTVYQILQDKEDYLWFGTSKGICRYDGYKFMTYSLPSMKDEEIIKVFQDDGGTIWIRNLSGQLFYITDGMMHLINLDNYGVNNCIDFTIVKNNIYIISKDINLARYNSFSLIKFNIERDYTFSNPAIILENTPKIQYFTQDNISFAFTFKNLDAYIKGNTTLKIIHIDKNNNILSIKPANLLIKNSNKFIQWIKQINKGEKLYCINGNKLILQNDFSETNICTLPNRETFNLYTKNDSTIYIASTNGLYSYSIFTKKISRILKNFISNTVLVDKEHTMWIGTKNSGILMIDHKKMEGFNLKNSNISTSSVYNIKRINEYNKLFFTQNNNLLNSIDANKHIKKQKINRPDRLKNIIIFKNYDFNYYPKINKKYFERTILNPNKEIKCLISPTDSIIISGDSFKTFKHNVRDKAKNLISPSIINIRTNVLFKDFQQRIWIGSIKGLFSYKDTTKRIFINDTLNPKSISDIDQTLDSNLWVSTFNNGVYELKNDSLINIYNAKNGLTSNKCNKIFIDSLNIYVATDKGVSLINSKTGKITQINIYDGLPTNEINDICVDNGLVYLGTTQGLMKFPENINFYNNYPPPIYITNLKIWDKDTSFNQDLDLNYNQNNLQISYIGLAYKAQGNIEYLYKLEGVDKKWVTTKSRYVRYPLLNPGKYSFKVLAMNEDGVKSTHLATLNITIRPPWWKTLWFIISTIIAISLIISYFLRRRINRIKREAKLSQDFQTKINDLKQKALQTQMNPHFIFNALNAIQHFMTVNDKKQSLSYLSKLAKLVRSIFELSKEKYITLADEIQFLNLYLQLEDLRFGEKINAKLEYSPEVEEQMEEICIPPLLLQPLVENAFKHGLFHKKGIGHLVIQFTIKDNILIVIIQDDGIGRLKSKRLSDWKTKKQKSSGINIARERLKIYNNKWHTKIKDSIEIEDLYDVNKEAIGTKITLKIISHNL